MGHIEDRWFKDVPGPNGKKCREKTDRHGVGLRYRVRYIAPDGKERNSSFPDRQKREAEAFLASVEADKNRGHYLDPQRGKKPFDELALAYVRNSRFDESTRTSVESRVRLHVIPFFGRRAVNTVYPGTLREWDTWLIGKGLSVNTRVVLFAHVSGILTAAVDDGRIAKNPCSAKSVTIPKPQVSKVVPWLPATVAAVRAAMPARYQVYVDLAAGCGTREGETFGISPEDFDAEWLTIRRQVKRVGSRLVFGSPKNDRERKTPLSGSVARSVRAHLAAFPAVSVTLPWEDPERGKMVTVPLILTTGKGTPLRQQTFDGCAWKPGLAAAGVPAVRGNGTHALRHLFASQLLAQGVSVRDLAEWMGHADPAFTLRVYGHLMPDSPGRARGAIDALLADLDDHHGPTTAPELQRREELSTGPGPAQGGSAPGLEGI
ncbi:tyrosine-type recombinase/integrase [Actinoplanes sp. DH11]|uniref:tyrosine-type recombinase/integrase n=1 Tax=Actinoplanes sp. DH11 TaxID=2857011 RepID=UPI001E3B69C0|nr:tyrosine-type recombinase/integrase [Actinoplanes sp. DH11]